MLTPAKLSDIIGKLGNFAPVGKELRGDTVQIVSVPNVSAGPEASPDDKPSNSVSDVAQPINDFDFGRLLQQYCRVQICTSEHCPHPRFVTSERFGISSWTTHELKQLIRLTVPFLLTVPFERQTAVRLPTHDNDNWSPLEAA